MGNILEQVAETCVKLDAQAAADNAAAETPTTAEPQTTDSTADTDEIDGYAEMGVTNNG